MINQGLVESAMGPHPPPLRHPPRVYLTLLTWWMLSGLPRFHCSSASVCYCQWKLKSKNGIGLGMSLWVPSVLHVGNLFPYG